MTLRNHNNSAGSSSNGDGGTRHGSAGGDSTRSTDTIKGPLASFSTVRNQPLKLHTKRQQYV